MSIYTVSSKEARANWRDLLDRVLSGDTDFLIERNGKPVAAIIPAEDYEKLIDELEDLRAARRAANVYQDWKRDHSIGRPYAEIREELVEDGVIDEHTSMESDSDEAA